MEIIAEYFFPVMGKGKPFIGISDIHGKREINS